MSQVTLVGYHFPKTGGTSLHSHAAAHLGTTHHYPFGHYNDTRRLYDSLPLLAEFRPGQARRIHFVYGHGVSLTTLAFMPANNIELFAVCRHPASRFVSSYKHYVRYRREAKPLSARAVFERQPPSPFAHEIMSRFAALTDPNAVTDEQKLISILQGVRFLLTTEILTERSADLFGAIGLPPIEGKRRVHNEEADLGDLTLNEIVERDHLDVLVHTAITGTTADGISSDLKNNPFGYRPERVAAARAAFISNSEEDQESRIKNSYFGLFSFHKADGRIHATKLFLEHSGRPAARTAFENFCKENSLDLKFEDLPARNWCFISDMYGRLGDREGQRSAAETALAAEPDSPRANFLVGREAGRSRDPERAIRLLTTATELHPTMPEAWYWLARASGKRGDYAAAQQSIERAMKLNPESKNYHKLRQRILEASDEKARVRPADADA